MRAVIDTAQLKYIFNNQILDVSHKIKTKLSDNFFNEKIFGEGFYMKTSTYCVQQ